MPQQRLGDILRARREQLGYSVDQAARTTNIRARVLEIFEKSDFANFPPPGYARGMLSSYARFLELDPRPVLDAYEAEFSEHDERATIATAANRVRKGQGRFGERRETTTRPLSRQTGSVSPREIQQGQDAIEQERVARHDDRYKSGSVRVVNTRPSSSTRRRTGARAQMPGRDTIAHSAEHSAQPRANAAARTRAPHTSAAMRDKIAHTPEVSSVRRNEGELGDDYSLRRESGERASRRASRRSTRSRTARDAAPESRGPVGRVLAAIGAIFKETRTRMIAIAALLIVIAVLVAANILISTAGNDGAGVIPVQGGAEDTTTTNTDSKDASATITTTNGNPITVQIDVADNQTSLINVTADDDSAYNGTAVGPWHREFQVTESMSATFGNPDAVSVVGNGAPIQIEKKSDGSGSLTLQIESTSTTDDST